MSRILEQKRPVMGLSGGRVLAFLTPRRFTFLGGMHVGPQLQVWKARHPAFLRGPEGFREARALLSSHLQGCHWREGTV